jgi:hypothetical protein
VPNISEAEAKSLIFELWSFVQFGCKPRLGQKVFIQFNSSFYSLARFSWDFNSFWKELPLEEFKEHKSDSCAKRSHQKMKERKRKKFSYQIVAR